MTSLKILLKAPLLQPKTQDSLSVPHQLNLYSKSIKTLTQKKSAHFAYKLLLNY